MIPAIRQQHIINLLGKTGIAAITELTELLNVSHMTVRRDIQKLEEAGRVVSVPGGVSLPTQILHEPPHLDKRGMRQSEKEAIARIAEPLITTESTIYLDAGTTTLALVKRFIDVGRNCENMLFVTNDLVIGLYIAENLRARMYFIGGMVDLENRSCVGEGAASALKNLNIDIAFISTPSWNMRWLSIPDQDKSLVKKAIAESSTRRILLSDSSKYGTMAAFNSVPISAFDAIVTDGGLPLAARESLAQHGVELLIAEL